MTAVLRFVGIAVWCAAVVSLTVTVVRIRRAHLLDRHIDEAAALTRPIGPEDDERWGADL